MPQLIEVFSPSGKKYDMPWKEVRDPSQAEIKSFIDSQSSTSPTVATPPTGVQNVKPVTDEEPSTFWSGFGKSLKDQLMEATVGNPALQAAAQPRGETKLDTISNLSSLLLPSGAPSVGKYFGFGKEKVPTSIEAKAPVNELPKPSLVTEKPNLPPEFTPVGSEAAPVKPTFNNPADKVYQKVLEQGGKKLNQTDLKNAEVVKQSIVSKPKLRVNNNDYSKVELINPNKQTVSQMTAKGYTPGAVNPDGSLTLELVSDATPSGIPIVNKPYGPGDYAMENAYSKARGVGNQYGPELTNSGVQPVQEIGGGGAKPPNPIEEVQPVAPTPKPPRLRNEQSLLIQGGNASKSLMAGMDLSAPLRQGRALMHKKEFYTSLDDMFKSAASEEGYNNVLSSIKENPHYERATNSGLSLTNLDEGMNNREESILSNFSEKIPFGIGKLYRGSNRAYTGFLNKLRMDTFSSLMENTSKLGKDINNPEFTSQVADFVNVATGRGKLPKVAESAAPLLNATLFSPRFMSSRLKLLTSPISYINADPFVRKEALKSLLALAGSQATMVGLWKMAGHKGELSDPTNADFAKFKVGNTRVDTNAGLQQLVKLFAQLGEGKETSSNTGRVTKLGTGQYGKPTYADPILSFLQSRTSPLLSFMIDELKGKDAVGNPVTLPSAVVKRITPMIAQDFYDIYQDDPKMLPLGIPGVFGAGVQTYGPKKRK